MAFVNPDRLMVTHGRTTLKPNAGTYEVSERCIEVDEALHSIRLRSIYDAVRLVFSQGGLDTGNTEEFLSSTSFNKRYPPPLSTGINTSALIAKRTDLFD